MNSSFYFSHTCFWFYCWSCCPASHRCMHFLIALSCCIITPAITLPSLSCYFVIPVVVLPFWWIVVCLRCSCCVAPATLLPQRWYHRVSPSCSLAFSSLSILCTHKSFRSLHHLPPCIVVYCHVCILTFDTLSNTEIKVIDSPNHLYLRQCRRARSLVLNWIYLLLNSDWLFFYTHYFFKPTDNGQTSHTRNH